MRVASQQLLLFAICSLFVASSGAAQSIGIGAGAAVPTGKLRESEKSGWLGQIMLTYGVGGSPLGVRLDGTYAELKHKSGAVGTTKLAGVTGDLVIQISGEAIKPYLVGAAGAYRVTVDSGQMTPFGVTRLALGIGTGVSFGVGWASLFIEARFMTVATSGAHTKFFPLTAGVSFALR